MSEEDIKNEEAVEETPATETPTAETPAEGQEATTTEATEATEGEAPKKEEKKRDIFAEIMGEEEVPVRIHKAKGSKNVASGIVHVTATFNNTLVSVAVTLSDGHQLVRWALKVHVRALRMQLRLYHKMLAVRQ